MYYNPNIGDVLVNEAREKFRVVYANASEILLELIPFCPPSKIVKREELITDLANGNLTYDFQLERDEIIMSAYQKRLLDIRKPFLEELHSLVENGHKPTSQATLEKLKSIVHDKYHIGKNKHSNKSICKWWKAFKDAGYNIAASIADRKPSPKRIDQASERFLSQYIFDTWAKGDTSNIAKAYVTYVDAVSNEKCNNHPLHTFSEKTFRNRIMSLNQFALIKELGSYSAIKKALLTLSSKVQVSRPMERVEMDRLSVNLALINDDGKPTGNVSLYIAIDCYTRYPVSVTYELGTAEDTEGVVRSLKRMLKQTDDQLSAFGLPEKVIVDNGPGYKSEAFKDVLKHLQIAQIKTPTNQPWKKPFVESFNNTLRKEFFEGASFTDKDGKKRIGIPGYLPKRTDKNAREISDSNVKNAAKLTIQDFEVLLRDYLIHYVNEPHIGLGGKTPQSAWNEAISRHPMITIPLDKRPELFHYKRHSVTLSERGVVRCHNQLFANKELKALYLQVKQNNSQQSLQVAVLYDPDDARYITVNAKFECLANEKVIEMVPNHGLSDAELSIPVSFEALNNEAKNIKRRDIFRADMPTLVKQEKATQGSGVKVPKAETNRKKALSVAERIEQSNNAYSNDDVSKGKAKKAKGNRSSEKQQSPSPERQAQEHQRWDDEDEEAV